MWGQKDWNKPWLSLLGSDSCQSPISTLRYSQSLSNLNHCLRGMEQTRDFGRPPHAPHPHCKRKRPFLLLPQGGLHTSQCAELYSRVTHSPSISFSASPSRSNPTMSPNGVLGLKMACNTAWSFRVPMMLNYKNLKRWLRKREGGRSGGWWQSFTANWSRERLRTIPHKQECLPFLWL